MFKFFILCSREVLKRFQINIKADKVLKKLQKGEETYSAFGCY